MVDDGKGGGVGGLIRFVEVNMRGKERVMGPS